MTFISSILRRKTKITVNNTVGIFLLHMLPCKCNLQHLENLQDIIYSPPVDAWLIAVNPWVASNSSDCPDFNTIWNMFSSVHNTWITQTIFLQNSLKQLRLLHRKCHTREHAFTTNFFYLLILHTQNSFHGKAGCVEKNKELTKKSNKLNYKPTFVILETKFCTH